MLWNILCSHHSDSVLWIQFSWGILVFLFTCGTHCDFVGSENCHVNLYFPSIEYVRHVSPCSVLTRRKLCFILYTWNKFKSFSITVSTGPRRAGSIRYASDKLEKIRSSIMLTWTFSTFTFTQPRKWLTEHLHCVTSRHCKSVV